MSEWIDNNLMLACGLTIGFCAILVAAAIWDVVRHAHEDEDIAGMRDNQRRQRK